MKVWSLTADQLHVTKTEMSLLYKFKLIACVTTTPTIAIFCDEITSDHESIRAEKSLPNEWFTNLDIL